MANEGQSERTFIFALESGAPDAAAIATELQLDVAHAADFAGGTVPPAVFGGNAVLFDRLGVVVATTTSEQVEALARNDWFRRRVVAHRESRRSQVRLAETDDAPVAAFDESDHTWGVQATRAAQSAFTGRGVRVAILDSALDVAHPDFHGRNARTVLTSVTPDPPDNSLCIHGTAVSGIVAGPVQPMQGPRYGVAPDCDLFFARVINDTCIYEDTAIIAGLEWAIANECRVANLSLGRGIDDNEHPNPVFDAIFAKAAAHHLMIVAAAGDESQRLSNVTNVKPVQEPANGLRAFAVGALMPDLSLLSTSNAGLLAGGGEVDAVAPGFSIRSARGKFHVPDRLYGNFLLTSMATAFVTGVAALWLEKDPGLQPDQLFQRLKATASPLGNAVDFGAGLVQAP